MSRYLSGETIQSIADSFLLKSRKPIRDILEKHEINVFHKYKLTENVVENVKKTYVEHGASVTNIAKDYLVDRSVIDRLLGKLKRSRSEQNSIIGANKVKLRGNAPEMSFDEFSRVVRYLTRTTYKHNKLHVNKRNLKLGRQDYVLDHNFSILDGYKLFCATSDYKIVWALAHPANLELVSTRVNAKKNSESWISYYELLERIRDWNWLYSCPYSLYAELGMYKQYDVVIERIGGYENYEKAA